MKAGYRMIVLALALMGGALATYLSVQAIGNDSYEEEGGSDDYYDDADYEGADDDEYSFLDDEDDLENQGSLNDFLDSDDL